MPGRDDVDADAVRHNRIDLKIGGIAVMACAADAPSCDAVAPKSVRRQAHGEVCGEPSPRPLPSL